MDPVEKIKAFLILKNSYSRRAKKAGEKSSRAGSNWKAIAIIRQKQWQYWQKSGFSRKNCGAKPFKLHQSVRETWKQLPFEQ